MARARRSSGGGLIVALVVFVVLTFVGIGAGVWLYQQNSIRNQAVKANQDAFYTSVASLFEEEGWELSEKEAMEYGFKYDEEAYADVAEKLTLAAEKQRMVSTLGWENADEARAALDVSALQEQQTEPYKTMEGLLGAYEDAYRRLRKARQTLEGQVKKNQRIIEDKNAEIKRVGEELGTKLEELEREHEKALEEFWAQQTELKNSYERLQGDLRQCRADFQEARRQWKSQEAQLREEVQAWRMEYRKAIGAGREEEEELTPAGRVLQVDPDLQLVVLQGGKDVERKQNQVFIVYSQYPSGERKRKAEVRVAEVHPTTTLGAIFSQTEQVIEGDLFVGEETWKSYQPAAEVAELPAEEEAAPPPPAEAEEEAEEAPPPEEEPEAAPPEPEEEAPAEEEEPEEEFIFEF